MDEDAWELGVIEEEGAAAAEDEGEEAAAFDELGTADELGIEVGIALVIAPVPPKLTPILFSSPLSRSLKPWNGTA